MLGINKLALHQRIKRGQSEEDAINAMITKAPKKSFNNKGQFKSKIYFTIDGKEKSLSEWCKIYNVDYKLVLRRYLAGWDIIEALTTPKKIYHKNKRHSAS